MCSLYTLFVFTQASDTEAVSRACIRGTFVYFVATSTYPLFICQGAPNLFVCQGAPNLFVCQGAPNVPADSATNSPSGNHRPTG